MRPTLAILAAVLLVVVHPASATAQSAGALADAARLLRPHLGDGRVALARERLCPASDPCPGATHDAAALRGALAALGATPASAASVRSCGATPDTCRLLGADILVQFGPAANGSVSAVVITATGHARAPLHWERWLVRDGKVEKVGES